MLPSSTTAKPTTHYEVINAKDELVGDLQHSTAAQAGLLRDALVADGHNEPLRVARVTEQVIVKRLIDIVYVEPQRVQRTGSAC